VPIPSIDLNQESNSVLEIEAALATGDFNTLAMDTVYYREGPCYSVSFASAPLFVVAWQAEPASGLIRTVTQALEDTPENAIIDSSFSANGFKGPMLLDKDGNYYRPGIFTWNSSSSIVPFNWLYFNYYGPHLITVEITDNAIQDYFEGDPLRQNTYALPKSNIVGGYGLFYSSYAQQFPVYVASDQD
jgi:hypothetical protein